MRKFVLMVNGREETYVNPDAVVKVFADLSNLATVAKLINGDLVYDDKKTPEKLVTDLEEAE